MSKLSSWLLFFLFDARCNVLLLAFVVIGICTCSPIDQSIAVRKCSGAEGQCSGNNYYFEDVSTLTRNSAAAESWPFSESAREQRGPRGCGTSTRSRTRIVGGRPADPREWPWMVALLRRDANHYCGGVLITDRHILTAAHCLQKLKSRDIIVRLGEYDFTRKSESHALDFRVTDIRVHENFDPLTYDNDIAILKIHRPTPFNTYIWPICLPPIGTTFENKTATVTGWGTRYYGGTGSKVLMEVSVPVWPQRLCEQSFIQRIRDSVMCAGVLQGGRDACQGDSGGPLMHQLGNGRWVNIGVVSWGIRCGEPGRPGIYTRVSTYLDWIFANAIF